LFAAAPLRGSIKNILSSTAFVGRVSYEMNLMPLPLNKCKEFWGTASVSAYEKLKVLAVTGGIPRYLEEIQPHLSAEQNIKRLCFIPGGFLVNEFEKIFNDLFLHDSNFYRTILLKLSNGPKQFKQICEALAIPQSGRISHYLYELEQAGFIKRYYSWTISVGNESNISNYRLNDNYLRFYFKYIESNRKKISNDKFAFQSLSLLPGWDSIIALQVENLVINNRELLIQSLGIDSTEIIADGPYLQRATKKYAGCQIDYMLQTRHNTLYLCEFKFSKSAIKKSVIAEVQEKVNKLIVPSGFSIRTVLIHVNGVTDAVEQSQYFAHVVNISEWLD